MLHRDAFTDFRKTQTMARANDKTIDLFFFLNVICQHGQDGRRVRVLFANTNLGYNVQTYAQLSNKILL